MIAPRSARLGVACAALAVAACRHPRPADVSLGTDADSCAAVRERVRGTGFALADVGPIESPHNRQPPDLQPQNDAGTPTPPFVLTYLVTTAGTVDATTIRATGSIDPRDEASLFDTVRRWRFTPARYHGCTVAHEARVAFSFAPSRR